MSYKSFELVNKVKLLDHTLKGEFLEEKLYETCKEYVEWYELRG
jgi:hypothetical protein